MSYNRSTPESSDEDLDMCRKGWNSNSDSDSDDDHSGFVVRQSRSPGGGDEEQFRDLFDKLRSTRSSNSASTKNLNSAAAETPTNEAPAESNRRDRDRRHIQDLSMDCDDDDEEESSSCEEDETSRGVYEEVSLAASKDAFQEYEEVTLGSKDALRDAPSGVYEEVSTSSNDEVSQDDDEDDDSNSHPSSTRGSSRAEEAAGIRSETDSYTDCTGTNSPTSHPADPSHNSSSSTGSTPPQQPRYQYTQQEMLILEENQRLKKEVYRLREEAREKDALISTLESQIMALVVAGRDEDKSNQRLISSDEENDSDTESDIESVADDADAELDVNETETTKRIANRTCMGSPHQPKRRQKQKQKQNPNTNTSRSHPNRIMSTHTNASSASPSLIAPPRRSSIEMKHPPAPYTEPPRNTKLNSLTPSTTLVSRKTRFQKSTAAIKALPRELSISNHSSRLFDDDEDEDSRAYGRKSRRKTRRKSGEGGDSSQEHYQVTNMEFMDAYNSRGIYTGTVQKATQMPHGKGKMVYHKGGRVGGRFYDGDWHVGHWHGYAILRDANGDIYEGQVVNDLKEGMGTIQFMDGRIFQGRFQQDEAAEGTMSYIDGAQYEGELHHGNRHGYGIYRFSDGSYYKGESVMNLFEGRGKMTWSDGGWYEGDWSKGEIHGFGKEYRPDGTLRHDGKWIKGVPIRIKNIHHHNGRR